MSISLHDDVYNALYCMETCYGIYHIFQTLAVTYICYLLLPYKHITHNTIAIALNVVSGEGDWHELNEMTEILKTCVYSE